MSIEDYDKGVSLTFRLPKEYREALKAYTKSKGITTSLYFRNCIEKILKDNKTLSLPSEEMPDNGKYKVLGIGLESSLYAKYMEFCHENNYKGQEVARGFMKSICDVFKSSSSFPVSSVLIYLVMFLVNEMKKEGYTFDGLGNIKEEHAIVRHPLLERQGSVWKVYDSETKTLYTIPFKKD